MPDSVVNWGILSTAKINHRLIPAIQSSDRGHLLGIASRNPDRASQYAEQHKIGRSYGSYADLISDPDIRAVYIPLPNDLHATWAINAMRAGKHVLLEKPFCMTMDEMDAIEQASRETGKTVAEAFMYLHHKQTHLIRSIIDSGKIGDIRTMSSNFCFTLNRPADNYRFIDRQGGGALWDVGVYPISMFQYLTDSEPLKVTGSARMANGVDLSYTGQMLYPGDITGQFFVSFESAFDTTLQIIGSKGKLTVTHPYTNPDACRMWVDIDDKAEDITLPRMSGYAGEVEDMHDVILNNTSPRISLEDTRRHIRTVLRLLGAAI